MQLAGLRVFGKGNIVHLVGTGQPDGGFTFAILADDALDHVTVGQAQEILEVIDPIARLRRVVGDVEEERAR